jgi:hypothetical protein
MRELMRLIFNKLELLATTLPDEIASAVPSLRWGRLAMTITPPYCHCEPPARRGLGPGRRSEVIS